MKGTPVAVPASVAEEAERTLKLLERAVDRISEYKFPELVVNIPDPDDFDDDDFDDQYTTFTCPWCQVDIDETELVSVDGATRQTNGEEMSDINQTTIQFDYDSGDIGEWQVLYLTCGRCEKPVSLPSNYDTDTY